ncbi:MAG: hemolysin family protein [Beijerinckiaceae bacterium]|nr:hemolysin family protein [Beijerinckiaceae bacterium]MDO9443631.1 hemolysin family protein [Beijerinckiaceae bacterium]
MFELIVAALLIALNGIFALSELALVSSRASRLKSLAEQGRRGAKTALRLSENPGKFLSTVQIGITLIGIVAGAFSGAALGATLSDILRESGLREGLAEPIGYSIVIGIITYLSVVVGELVPKQLALRHPEGIACAVAPAMLLLSKIGAPIVWILDASTRLIFRLLGLAEPVPSAVTEEEIKSMVEEATSAGIIEIDERRMISGVLRLGDRAVRAIMTPRTDVDWIDIADEPDAIRAKLAQTTHSRLPVGEGSPDNIVGIIQLRDLLPAYMNGVEVDLRSLIREAPVLPDRIDALEALNALREAPVPIALIHDEYGHFEGLVTPADILDAIAGAFKSDETTAEPEAVERDDGSWLLAGWMPVDEMSDQLGINLPRTRAYETVAGLIIDKLHHLPATGEFIDTLGWRFEVVDLDGRRIDKVLARKLDEGEIDG